MKQQSARIRHALILAVSLFAIGVPVWETAAAADAKLVVTPVVEKKVKQLPAGELYWEVETFPGLAEAQAAAGPTSLAAEIAGKAWLLTLGDKGAATHGGTKVAEVGPIAPVTAPEYLLRINHAVGPPGAKTSIHSHPGSEAFYVLAGRLGQRTPHGTAYADAGQTMAGHGPDVPMQVFSAGTTDLDQIVMFVLDATKPASSPAKLD
jgi:mannose-6-phosphate isomerase-like protein (cupin superfamily)